jgi:2-polyprenyl-3-methyl-5-hydroxy-6-metoxy-1,4-benzoquinol methylase
MIRPTLNCPCERRFDEPAFKYDAPPAGETRFDLGGQTYCRAYSCCRLCGHWYSDHKMDLTNLYSGAYVASTYGDRMRETFDRILALPAEKSDNTGRVARVLGFGAKFFPSWRKPTLLDVGSGLGVFPYRMKEAGWNCSALDPDPCAVAHLKDVVGVQTVTGDFMSIGSDQLGTFDVITFNKVLEHVEDPIAMLSKASRHLNPGGFVYVEVPDGETAAVDGPEREEFFIEHHHVFSVASLAMMASRAGFCALDIERLREPSTKYTLRAFLVDQVHVA